MNKKENIPKEKNKPTERISQWICKYGPGVAIIISIISVFLAWLPFYYQYIRRHNDLKATIVSFAMDHPEEISYISDVVFINNGNRPCAIIGVETQMQNVNATEPPYTGILSTPCSNHASFTIKPNEVITKQLWMGKGRIEDTKFSSYGKEKERLKFSIAFEIIDSLGNYHKVETPICSKIIGEESITFPDRIPKTAILLPSEIKKDFVAIWPRRIDK